MGSRLFLFFVSLLYAKIGFAVHDPFLKNPVIKWHEAFIPIHYADAANLSQSLNSSQLGLLSSAGKIYADTRSNQLYVKEDLAHFNKIRDYIHGVDIPMSQILIQAKIVSIDHHYARDLGLIFKTQKIEKSSALHFQEEAINALQIPIIKFSNSNLLNLQIQALEEAGHATILSKPEIMTLDRQEGSIESGEEIPYQESTSSGATNITFKKAVLKLKVKPVLLPARKLLLTIKINEDKVSALRVNGIPAIATQQLTTSAMMQNGQTLVLGGIFESEESESKRDIPGLSKIPLVGNLMSEKRRNVERKELLIFIQPQILSESNYFQPNSPSPHSCKSGNPQL